MEHGLLIRFQFKGSFESLIPLARHLEQRRVISEQSVLFCTDLGIDGEDKFDLLQPVTTVMLVLTFSPRPEVDYVSNCHTTREHTLSPLMESFHLCKTVV